jgi:excinuclease UvrABC nuclease subunit
MRGIANMLPDFPKVKEKVLETLNKRMQARSTPSPFQNAKHLRYHVTAGCKIPH